MNKPIPCEYMPLDDFILKFMRGNKSELHRITGLNRGTILHQSHLYAVKKEGDEFQVIKLGRRFKLPVPQDQLSTFPVW